MMHKKIKLLLLSSLIFVFFPYSLNAQEKCDWGYIYTPGAGGGANYKAGCTHPTVESDSSKCSGKEKPANVSNYLRNFACCCTTNAVQEKSQSALFEAPDIKITIPGMKKLSDVKCDGEGVCDIPWIGQYIKGIYNYAIAIAGILAAVVMMGGGVLWLISRGDASKITKAKELIFGSIIGLIILLGSYLILHLINPELTKLKSIVVKNIEPKSLGGDSYNPYLVNASDSSGLAAKLGIICGQDSLSDMVNKSLNKISYSQRLKTQFINGYVHFDCSSYTHFLLKCAYGKNITAYTGAIFKEETVWDENINKLQAGDLVGWMPKHNAGKNKDNPKGDGHVFIYIGNSQFADCHGNSDDGKCVSRFSLQRVLKYKNTHSNGNLYFKRP